MYWMTAGPQPGIGTQLVQRTDGVGQYIETSSYMLTPAGQAGIRGLGCSGGPDCGCGCGVGCCGVGLFDTGVTDVAAWGWPEWLVVAFGAYVVGSVLFTTKRAAGAVRRAPGATRRKARAVKRALAA